LPEAACEARLGDTGRRLTPRARTTLAKVFIALRNLSVTAVLVHLPNQSVGDSKNSRKIKCLDESLQVELRHQARWPDGRPAATVCSLESALCRHPFSLAVQLVQG
jgi:hypothetical protein